MHLLSPEKYDLASHHLRQVTFNNLFARAVVEQKISGKVYADDPENPTTFYILHPYGMSLLLGNCQNRQFNEAFRQYALNTQNGRQTHEWMQAYPADWHNTLKDLFGNKLLSSAENMSHLDKEVVELNTRVNFRFNPEKYQNTKTENSDPAIRILRTDYDLFNRMQGSVIPSRFWNNASDFLTNGAGFSLLYNGKLAATAYSAFRFEDTLELGIETGEEFRGNGFARLVCSALIDYCLEHQLEPVWACRLENTGSYRLALKLGFEPVLELPYYRLSR